MITHLFVYKIFSFDKLGVLAYAQLVIVLMQP